MTDTTTDPLEASPEVANEVVPETTVDPTYVSKSNKFTFASEAQEDLYNDILQRNGWTEVAAIGMFPKVKTGRGMIGTLISLEQDQRNDAMRGRDVSDLQLERLLKDANLAQEHGLTEISNQAMKVYNDLAADRLVVHKCIDAVEQRLSVRGIVIPWSKEEREKASAQAAVDNGGESLEGSVAVGAVDPNEEPF